MVKTLNFDLVIIGGGSGLNVIPSGMNVAVIEKGPMGGTCLNRGCIPSKIVIHSADIAEDIREASKFGLNAKLNSVNLSQITGRASNLVDNDSKKIERNINADKEITLFKGTAKFIGNKTLKINNQIIKGDKIVIAAGARSNIPNIEGIDKVDYWTSTEALRVKKQPKILTIIGGGYIATELGHFFSNLGTKLNIVVRGDKLVPNEDEEVSKRFTEIWKKKHDIYFNTNSKKVYKKNGKFYLETDKKTLVSDALLIVAGIKPNSDTLDVKKTGVKVNKNGYVVVNEYLETNVKGIYALGDIIGTFGQKHSANYEAEIVFKNAVEGSKVKRDYKAMPHAISSSPQIAGVGATEQELREKKIKYITGKYDYIKTGMGEALQDKDGFAKVLIDPKTRKFLGCHIIGTDASAIIHEVIVAMRNDLTADELAKTVHIHPALSEVIQRATFNALSKL